MSISGVPKTFVCPIKTSRKLTFRNGTTRKTTFLWDTRCTHRKTVEMLDVNKKKVKRNFKTSKKKGGKDKESSGPVKGRREGGCFRVIEVIGGG